jgi:hypothetical protein
MTIGSSPFLTADVDETIGGAQHRELPRLATASDIVSVRVEMIRRRVLTGYYSSPMVMAELARRLADPSGRDDTK